MGVKIKSIIYNCDFIGLTPQLRILNETRYKSIFSSLLSIFIIIFSIAFASYSFSEYIKQNPNVEYYKNNDYITNKTFEISDSLLMFRYFFMCSKDYSTDHDLEISSVNQYSLVQEKFSFETCELGKNINIKYSDVIKKFEETENLNISDFNCINYNNTKLTLYSHPSMSHEKENYLSLELSAKCEKFDLIFQLVTQNDLIDHTNKNNPIIPHYQLNNIMVENTEKIYLVYNFQFIKYETDNGIIFSNETTINGVGFSGSNPFDRVEVGNKKFTVDFRMNFANYDYYKRVFIKFQSFLADVMSLINLLIAIGKIVSEILLSKKMNKDIIRNILSINEEKEKYNKEKDLFSKEKKFSQILETDKETSLEKKNKECKKIGDSEIINNEYIFTRKTDDVMKKLKVLNIIKSFFCFKDKKTKLIDLCDIAIKKDLCTERILKRLYSLENFCNVFVEKDKYKLCDDKEISQIKNLIICLDRECNEKDEKKRREKRRSY